VLFFGSFGKPVRLRGLLFLVSANTYANRFSSRRSRYLIRAIFACEALDRHGIRFSVFRVHLPGTLFPNKQAFSQIGCTPLDHYGQNSFSDRLLISQCYVNAYSTYLLIDMKREPFSDSNQSLL